MIIVQNKCSAISYLVNVVSCEGGE